MVFYYSDIKVVKAEVGTREWAIVAIDLTIWVFFEDCGRLWELA